MNRLSFLVVLMIGQPSVAVPKGERVGELKGVQKMGQILGARMGASQTPFFLHTFLGEYGSETPLSDLLGYQAGATLTSYQNGSPNGANMVVWEIISDQIADHISQIPDGGQLQLRDDVRDLLVQIRDGWNQEGPSGQRDFTESLWLLMMSFEAPKAQFERWQAFFLTEYAHEDGTTALRAMVYSILWDPYFLLER